MIDTAAMRRQFKPPRRYVDSPLHTVEWRFHDRSWQYPKVMVLLSMDLSTRQFFGYRYRKDGDREDYRVVSTLDDATVAIFRAMLTNRQLAEATAAAIAHQSPTARPAE